MTHKLTGESRYTDRDTETHYHTRRTCMFSHASHTLYSFYDTTPFSRGMVSFSFDKKVSHTVRFLAIRYVFSTVYALSI